MVIVSKIDLSISLLEFTGGYYREITKETNKKSLQIHDNLQALILRRIPYLTLVASTSNMSISLPVAWSSSFLVISKVMS